MTLSVFFITESACAAASARFIRSITQAESEAEAIKAEALLQCAKIAEEAEAEKTRIADKCEEECKLYRERGVAEACAEADRRT